MSRSREGTWLTTRSPMRTTPREMSSRPATIRSAVVFPHPDGPTSTMNSPSSIPRSREFTAVVPSGYVLVTPSNVTPAKRGSPVDSGVLQLLRRAAQTDPPSKPGFSLVAVVFRTTATCLISRSLLYRAARISGRTEPAARHENVAGPRWERAVRLAVQPDLEVPGSTHAQPELRPAPRQRVAKHLALLECRLIEHRACRRLRADREPARTARTQNEVRRRGRHVSPRRRRSRGCPHRRTCRDRRRPLCRGRVPRRGHAPCGDADQGDCEGGGYEDGDTPRRCRRGGVQLRRRELGLRLRQAGFQLREERLCLEPEKAGIDAKEALRIRTRRQQLEALVLERGEVAPANARLPLDLGQPEPEALTRRAKGA